MRPVTGEVRIPRLARAGTSLAELRAEVLPYAIWHNKLRIRIEAVGHLGEPYLVNTEWFTVRLFGVLLVRCAVANVALHDDQGRPVMRVDKSLKCASQPLEIVGVGDMQDLPAEGLEPRPDILAERDRRRAFDTDMVRVVDPAEIGQLQVTGERRRLAADALHHVAVAAQCVNVVVEHVAARAVVGGGEPGFSGRHSDAGRDTLAKRTGRGLDTRGPAVFRMAGAAAACLAKAPQIGERHRESTRPLALPFITRARRSDTAQIEQAVEQGRCVAHREHEAVAVRPLRVVRVVAQKTLPQAIGGGRRAHRRARMAGVGLLNRIDGQRAQGVDAQKVGSRNITRGDRRHLAGAKAARKARILKDVNPLTQAPSDLRYGLGARHCLRAVSGHRIPEACASNGEADETIDFRGSGQPAAHFGRISATAQHDTANRAAAVVPGGFDNAFAIIVAAHTLDLPDVGLDTRLLQFANRHAHQDRTQAPLVRRFVATLTSELFSRRRNQQFKHEATLIAPAMVRQHLQPLHLSEV